MNNTPSPTPPDCYRCGCKMVLRTTTKFKTRSGHPRTFYGCTAFPACNATHPSHPDGTPYGRPTDDLELRAMRIACHELFDPIWRDGHMDRKAAYAQLREWMQMDEHEGHISMMDKEACTRLKAHLVEYWARHREAGEDIGRQVEDFGTALKSLAVTSATT